MTDNKLTMTTEIPIKSGMTVEDLKGMLDMVPESNASLSVRTVLADRWGADTHNLVITWTKVINNG